MKCHDNSRVNLDGKKLLGVISDRDALRFVSPFLNTLSETTRDINMLDWKIHQIMTRRPVTVSGSTSIKTAMQLLLDKNISCLPVVNTADEIIGVVTWKDMLKAYLNQKRDSSYNETIRKK